MHCMSGLSNQDHSRVSNWFILFRNFNFSQFGLNKQAYLLYQIPTLSELFLSVQSIFDLGDALSLMASVSNLEELLKSENGLLRRNEFYLWCT